MEREIPQMIAALAAFGCVVILPLTMMLLRHQRQMAELMRQAPDEMLHRLQVVEEELRSLKAAHIDLVIREEDQREIRQRLN